MVELDETAAAVLERLVAPCSVAALTASLSAEFEGEDLAADVAAFVEDARARGWIRDQA
jgi:hypothetical protein